MDIKPQRKILRSPSVKRKTKVLPVDQRLKLERVLGVTVSTNSSLDVDSNNGTIAYPAGCVTVLYNPQRNKQSYIFNSCRKFISAVAFSRDGKYLVTGENGHQPAVRVWDVAENTQVAELLGHKFGVNCVTFSPNMKDVVSVGTQHDMMVIVWNWKSGNKVASNKVSSKVSAIAYSEDGKCFVTVGNRHVRFWYLEDRRSKINQTVPLAGRSGILGDQKDNFFCDVVSGKGSMSGRFFVITRSGLLCEINEKRHLDKWVELRTRSANCITSGTEHIFVGCSEGVIRVFSATTLHYLCSLPKPHHLGVEITTATTASHMVSGREDANYPDTKCIAFDDDHKKVTCVYNDRSIYIWDVHDLKRVGKAWSFLYHSGCIWALEMYPQLEEGTDAMLPPGSFITGSRDDTIRVWNLNTHMPENTAYKRNIYSNELLKVIYTDPSLGCLTDVDYNPAGGTDKTDTKYDDKNGVRSIRVSPDGNHLASGDRQGNIRVYDMKYLNEVRCVEAHDSDVMCLEYTYNKFGQFLATASRDRLIHVFDVEQNYGLVQTLGDHSSSITAVRFTDNNDKLGMISCGADKSILLRNAVTTPEFQFQLEHHLATKLTLYDMVIDPTQKYIATACQDRNVRLYNIQSRKEKKCYKGSSGDDGILLRIHLDPSGSFAATACTDKSICIVDFESGEMLASFYGHSETITGVKFANDLKHLITVSADGCIFVWRLPSEMTTQIKTRLMELGKESRDADYFRSADQLMMPHHPISMSQSSFGDSLPIVKAASVANIHMTDTDSVFSGDFHDGDDEDEDDNLGRLRPTKKPMDDSVNPASLAYRFSIGQLPNWAKAKFGEGGSEGSESSQELAPPKGRWAQRVDRSVEFKSQLDLTSDDESAQSDRRRDLSSHPNLSQLSDPRRQTFVVGKQAGNKNAPTIDDLRASTGDLTSHSKRGDFATPTRSDTFIYSRNKAATRFDILKGYTENSLDLDDADDLDTGSDTTEVIYPPTESDSDYYASSYQIFATEEDKKKTRRSSSGVANLDDVTSESTDPISLEEEEEGTVISNPTTPSDPEKEFLPWDPDKEDFVKENFELDLERGSQGSNDSSTPFSPRLSLSARFMSRAQPKQSASATGAYRSDNWFSRNKMEMSRAMDETRKSLLAMNIRSTSPEEMDDSPSPPVKLDSNSFKSGLYPSSPPAVLVSPPPYGLGSKNLRVCWAAFALSHHPIREDSPTLVFPASHHPCCHHHHHLQQPQEPPQQQGLQHHHHHHNHQQPHKAQQQPQLPQAKSRHCPGCQAPTTPHPPATQTESVPIPISPRKPLMYQSRIPTPTSSPRPTRTKKFSNSPPITIPTPGPPNGHPKTHRPTPSPDGSPRVTSRPTTRALRIHPRAGSAGSTTSSTGSPTTSRSFPGVSSSNSNGRHTSSSRHHHCFPRVEQGQESSRLNTSGPLAKRINKEKERRRSASSKTSDLSSSSADSTTKASVRTRPSYFKTTASSRNKVNRDAEPGTSGVTSSPSRTVDPSKRRSYVKTEGKMPSSKLSFYASSPNLALALDAKDDEDDEKDQDEMPMKTTLSKGKGPPAKIKSMSNLKALADLSRSVPDINDSGSSTDSSSSTGGGPTSQPQRKSVFGPAAKITSRYSSGMTDKDRMPPPATGGASSLVSKKRQDKRERSRSGSTSELTLDEAKSILLGKSGILANPKSSNTVTNLTVAPVTSITQRQGQISSSNSSSIPGQSDIIPMFEPTPSQLAVAEEIEHTANMLRHQNQANISNAAYSSNNPSNLEASPQDLPERDGPPPARRRSSHSSAMTSLFPSSSTTTSSISSYSSPSSQPAHMSSSSSSSNTPTTLHHNLDLNEDENNEQDSKPQSVRDRIARLNTPKSSPVVSVVSTFNSKPGRTSSPHRRVLPASPLVLTTTTSTTPASTINAPIATAAAAGEVTDSSRVSSDTGLGSESDLDSLMGGHISGAHGPNQKPDRSKLALTLNSPPSSIEQVRNCKIALDDLRSQLSKLKDLFAQVDGRTDESSRVILTMMGQAFHEAQSTIMELASQTPSMSPNVSATTSLGANHSQPHQHPSSLSSSSSSSSSPAKTFQPSSSSSPSMGSNSSTLTNGNESPLSSVSSSATPTPKHITSSVRDLTSHQVAALATTKEVLEPLVSQLSQDLSDGILKLIREKLDQA